MSVPNWISAEQSFVSLSSRTTVLDWGQFSLWADGEDNPKLSFLRLLRPDLVKGDFVGICSEYRRQLDVLGYKLYIRIPWSTPIPPEIIQHLEFGGTPLAFMETGYFPSKTNSDVSVVQVSDPQQLEDWWLLYSTYPTRETKLLSPYYRVVQKAFEEQTQFYLAFISGRPVGTAALDRYAGGFNLWGAFVDPEFRGLKVHNTLIAALKNTLGGRYSFQTNMGSHLFNAMTSKPETTLQMVERRFKYVADSRAIRS